MAQQRHTRPEVGATRRCCCFDSRCERFCAAMRLGAQNVIKTCVSVCQHVSVYMCFLLCRAVPPGLSLALALFCTAVSPRHERFATYHIAVSNTSASSAKHLRKRTEVTAQIYSLCIWVWLIGSSRHVYWTSDPLYHSGKQNPCRQTTHMGNPPRFLSSVLACVSRDRLLHFEELHAH